MPSPAVFALALLRLDGVGRVTAHRILEHFGSAETLRETPREQVRLRLRGVPRADETVAKTGGYAWSCGGMGATAKWITSAPVRTAY